MTDSSKFTSLFDLVDSHLSKTSIQNEDGTTSYKIPSLNGSVSESLLSIHGRPRLPISRLSTSESPIQANLNKQIANMLIAKEKRQQEEERQRLAEEMKRLKLEEEKSMEIDLVKAIQTPYNRGPRPEPEETLSRNSSIESLYNFNFKDLVPEPELPLSPNMIYILKKKIKRGKCSPFGRVISSRLKPVPAPFLREKITTNIPRFDFSTPSPCDIAKAERVFKPAMSCTFKLDITKFV